MALFYLRVCVNVILCFHFVYVQASIFVSPNSIISNSWLLSCSTGDFLSQPFISLPFSATLNSLSQPLSTPFLSLSLTFSTLSPHSMGLAIISLSERITHRLFVWFYFLIFISLSHILTSLLLPISVECLNDLQLPGPPKRLSDNWLYTLRVSIL